MRVLSDTLLRCVLILSVCFPVPHYPGLQASVYKGVSRYPLVNPFTRGLTLVPLVNKVLDSQADPRMPDWVSFGLL